MKHSTVYSMIRLSTQLILVFSFLNAQLASAGKNETLPVRPDLSQAKSSSKKSTISPAKEELVLKIEGQIYPLDGVPEACKDISKGVKCPAKPFATYLSEAKKIDHVIYSHVVFRDSDGPQVIEQSWQEGGKVQRAIIENRAKGTVSELEVKNGRAYYKTTEKDGDVKRSEAKAEENLVVPSTVMAYLNPLNDDLRAGKEIDLRVAVLDRRESFGFTIKKVRTEKGVGGREIMVLKMAPTSIFVRAVVSPMYYSVWADNGEIFAFEGRSAVRRKIENEYEPMDSRTAYQYKFNALAKRKTAQVDGCSTQAKSHFDAAQCEVSVE